MNLTPASDQSQVRDLTKRTNITHKGTTELDSVSGTPSTNEFKVTVTGTDITSSIAVENNYVVSDHSSRPDTFLPFHIQLM